MTHPTPDKPTGSFDWSLPYEKALRAADPSLHQCLGEFERSLRLLRIVDAAMTPESAAAEVQPPETCRSDLAVLRLAGAQVQASGTLLLQVVRHIIDQS